MYNLDKQIDEYSEELFADLGLAILPEEQKADLYARVQEHLHAVIIELLRPMVRPDELTSLHAALEQEDYRVLGRTLKRYSQLKKPLEDKIEAEFQKLKLTIAEELKHADRSKGDAISGISSGNPTAAGS